MAVQDKYADEILSDDELDVVVGGTNGEYKALRNLLPTITFTQIDIYNNKMFKVEKTRYMDTNEVSDWLKANLNIDAKIDTGGWWNPFNSAGEANTYSRNGNSLTHEQVIGEVKSFLGK